MHLLFLTELKNETIMTQKELNELLEQVEYEFRIFEHPSANNSRKMMKFLQEAVKNNGVLPLVINWAFFPEDKPNYGDEILIYPPPEQLAKKEVLIYGRYTDLIDGTKWALLTPCL